MNQAPRDINVAGFLGILLGAAGIHNFYLGDKKKGILHASIFGAVVAITIIFHIAVSVMSPSAVANAYYFLINFKYVLYAGIVGNIIWGIIEGVKILMRGNVGAVGAPNTSAPAPQITAPQPMQEMPALAQPTSQTMMPQPMPTQISSEPMSQQPPMSPIR